MMRPPAVVSKATEIPDATTCGSPVPALAMEIVYRDGLAVELHQPILFDDEVDILAGLTLRSRVLRHVDIEPLRGDEHRCHHEEYQQHEDTVHQRRQIDLFLRDERTGLLQLSFQAFALRHVSLRVEYRIRQEPELPACVLISVLPKA